MTAGNRAQYAIAKLAWMRVQRIRPNGLRYLWTDAFGLVPLVAQYSQAGDRKYLAQAQSPVAAVLRVLGRSRAIRIGTAADGVRLREDHA